MRIYKKPFCTGISKSVFIFCYRIKTEIMLPYRFLRHLPTFQNAQFDTRPTIFHHFDPRRPYWWSFEWLPTCMMFSASQSTLSALQILRNHLCWCLPTKIIQKITSKLVKWDFLCVIFLLIWLKYSLIVFLDLRFPIFSSHI